MQLNKETDIVEIIRSIRYFNSGLSLLLTNFQALTLQQQSLKTNILTPPDELGALEKSQVEVFPCRVTD